MTTTLLPASILPGLLEVSLRSRLDVQSLFERAGIDADIVGRNDRFISLLQLDELLYSAFTESDDPLFGLHVGADNHYGNLDLLGNLMAYNAITIPASLLAEPLPRAYPKYNERLRQSADQVLSGLSRAAGVSGQVIKQLEIMLGGQGVTMEAVADALAMTPRTLQRRLQEEGTRFAQLRDQVRHQHACQALREPGCDMQALALELGFSDTANFYHAFKRWQGCAPGQYRKQFS